MKKGTVDVDSILNNLLPKNAPEFFLNMHHHLRRSYSPPSQLRHKEG